MRQARSWLCPTELDRARVVEAGGRVRHARTTSAAVIGIALLAVAPWLGWWSLGLFAVCALNLGTMESRLRRSERPERVAAASVLLNLLLLAVLVGFSGGPKSPLLAWLVLPGAMAASRFRRHVVVVASVLTTAVVLLTTIPVDPRAFLHDPTMVIATLALLVCITTVTSALMRGELVHRDRAVLDPLTGLLNRSAIEARARELEQQAHLTGGSVSLIVVDLDSFKRVNDSHGHDRGDAVLRDTAYELRKSLRSFELVYRIGGEEFVILLPAVELAEAIEIAERLRRAVSQARPGDLELTLSAGVATAAGSQFRFEQLFRAADRALLDAKRGGRNHVVADGQPSGMVSPGAGQLEADRRTAPLA